MLHHKSSTVILKSVADLANLNPPAHINHFSLAITYFHVRDPCSAEVYIQL